MQSTPRPQQRVPESLYVLIDVMFQEKGQNFFAYDYETILNSSKAYWREIDFVIA